MADGKAFTTTTVVLLAPIAFVQSGEVVPAPVAEPDAKLVTVIVVLPGVASVPELKRPGSGNGYSHCSR